MTMTAIKFIFINQYLDWKQYLERSNTNLAREMLAANLYKNYLTMKGKQALRMQIYKVSSNNNLSLKQTDYS